MKKFKCNLCDKSGSIHTRCDEYFAIKAENERIKQLKNDYARTHSNPSAWTNVRNVGNLGRRSQT